MSKPQIAEMIADLGSAIKNDNLSFYSKQAARTLGVDQRTVQRDLRRGKNIAPEVMAEVSGTALDKGVVLDELAKTPRDEQAAKLSEIARAELSDAQRADHHVRREEILRI